MVLSDVSCELNKVLHVVEDKSHVYTHSFLLFLGCHPILVN